MVFPTMLMPVPAVSWSCLLFQLVVSVPDIPLATDASKMGSVSVILPVTVSAVFACNA